MMTILSPCRSELMPPECCQPDPVRCRACGSCLVMPTLLVVGQWECWRCDHTWILED